MGTYCSEGVRVVSKGGCIEEGRFRFSSHRDWRERGDFGGELPDMDKGRESEREIEIRQSGEGKAREG